MKERFTISMDHELAAWLDKLCDEKIFSSRSHGIEFCVKQIEKMNIEKIILLHWGREEVEPVFISKKNNQILCKISEKLDLSPEDTLSILLYKELENISKNIEFQEQESKKENVRKTFFE
ncbi:MAG: ribbon-helix-helix domain-containing protein [Methanosarcina sp.]